MPLLPTRQRGTPRRRPQRPPQAECASVILLEGLSQSVRTDTSGEDNEVVTRPSCRPPIRFLEHLQSGSHPRPVQAGLFLLAVGPRTSSRWPRLVAPLRWQPGATRPCAFAGSLSAARSGRTL